MTVPKIHRRALSARTTRRTVERRRVTRAALAMLGATLLGACTGGERDAEHVPAPHGKISEMREAAGERPDGDTARRDEPAFIDRAAGAVSRAQSEFGSDVTILTAPARTSHPRQATSPASEARRLLPRPSPPPSDPALPRSEGRERYQALEDNATVRTADEPVSTFSVDVDTGSYANVRRFLEGGLLPPKDAVRIEELVNYFDYDYSVPDIGDVPFSVTTELGPTPWNADTRLLRIGLKGYEPAPEARPAANLVFLVDVSGSMDSPDKLGLLKTSLNLLAGELTAEDRVGIVVYAGASGIVLEPVPGDSSKEIGRALDSLAAGGSTNGEAGIEQAYRLADEHFVNGGVNRVILATDGDFNVGLDDTEALIDLIGKRRESGIALSTLGFGTGNYDDHLMERLADVGDGSYAYIDTLNEARKVLVEELAATLLTVARDVKVQFEFNPAVVAEYRLVGYTNRVLADEDFRDDRVDAGEIGAGHTVTALYEIALHGEGGERHAPRRYGAPQLSRNGGDGGAKNADDRGIVPFDRVRGDAAPDAEIGELRLRYKRPDEDESRSLDARVLRADVVDVLGDTSDDFRFAAAVAAFGQGLRNDTRAAGITLEEVVRLAAGAKGEDRFGYRGDFVRLAELASSLTRLADPLTRRRHDENEG